MNASGTVSSNTGLHVPGERRQHHRWSRVLRRASRNRFALGGFVVVIVMIVLALGAPFFATHGVRAISAASRFQGPSTAHFFGTDNLGRDLFSRIIYGIRMSAVIAGSSIAVALIIGVLLGLIAGYVGSWTDEVLMRLMDIIYAFPPLLLALTIVAVFGTGAESIIAAIAIGRIPGFARITRAAVLAQRANEFVDAAVSIGASHRRVLLRHILPNCLAPIIVMTSISAAVAILTEASLSFLGLGIQPPTPSLGGLLKDSLPYLSQAPWLAIFPGVVIAVVVFALNLLGDGLRDLLDPRTN
ncbi:MAG: ABC transporter permease [Thermomicrobiales bacterium]